MGLKLTDSLGHSGLVLVYFTTLDGQQLYLQCVPIIPSKQYEIALEQVQLRDQVGLSAAHTNPVFG